MNKENVVYICLYTMEYYSATRKKILPLVKTWMNLEGITLSEISQTEKCKKSHKKVSSHLYMES